MENDCIPAASVPMLVSDLARLGAVPNDFPLSHVLAETCTVYRMAFIIDPDREAYSQEELIQAAEKLELQGAADDYQDSVIKTIAQYEVVLELQKEKKEETAHTEKLLDCLRQQLTHYVRARAVAVCVSKPRMKVAAEDRVVRALVDIFRFYTKQHALAHVRKTFDAVNAELSQMGLGYFTKLLKDYNIEADQKVPSSLRSLLRSCGTCSRRSQSPDDTWTFLRLWYVSSLNNRFGLDASGSSHCRPKQEEGCGAGVASGQTDRGNRCLRPCQSGGVGSPEAAGRDRPTTCRGRCKTRGRGRRRAVPAYGNRSQWKCNAD